MFKRDHMYVKEVRAAQEGEAEEGVTQWSHRGTLPWVSRPLGDRAGSALLPLSKAGTCCSQQTCHQVRDTVPGVKARAELPQTPGGSEHKLGMLANQHCSPFQKAPSSAARSPQSLCWLWYVLPQIFFSPSL